MQEHPLLSLRQAHQEREKVDQSKSRFIALLGRTQTTRMRVSGFFFLLYFCISLMQEDLEASSSTPRRPIASASAHDKPPATIEPDLGVGKDHRKMAALVSNKKVGSPKRRQGPKLTYIAKSISSPRTFRGGIRSRKRCRPSLRRKNDGKRQRPRLRMQSLSAQALKATRFAMSLQKKDVPTTTTRTILKFPSTSTSLTP